MDEFISIGSAPMSSDETPQIESKIEPFPTTKDAPPLAAIDQPAAPETAKPDVEAATPEIKVEAKAEAPTLQARLAATANTEPVKTEPAKTELPKLELSTSQAPTLPPAPQLAEPSATVIPLKKPDRKSTR